MSNSNDRNVKSMSGYVLVICVSLISPKPLDKNIVSQSLKPILEKYTDLKITEEINKRWDDYYLGTGFSNKKALISSFSEVIGVIENAEWRGTVRRFAAPIPSSIDETWTNEPTFMQESNADKFEKMWRFFG